MIAAIYYELPDDEYDYKNAIKANDMISDLVDIYNICRNYFKYGEDRTVEKLEELLQEIKDLSGTYIN